MDDQLANSIWPIGALRSTDRTWCADHHREKLLPFLGELLYELRHSAAETTDEYLALIIAEAALGE